MFIIEDCSHLIKNSLNSISVENPLQKNAIYWEVGHRTYFPWLKILQPIYHKKVTDLKIRRWLGIDFTSNDNSFVFYGDTPCFRKYNGDPLLYDLYHPIKKPMYCFSPTGTKRGYETDDSLLGYNSIKGIFASAFKVDLDGMLREEYKIGE